MLHYEAPSMELITVQANDILTASGFFWTNEPDWDDDPHYDGGFDAEDQIGDFWETEP